MAECSITSVQVVNNPAPFANPIVLEVQYECLSALRDDLEWRVTYVGSADNDGFDQVLDSALVGPVQPGVFKFRMEAPAPDVSRIPPDDLLGVTVLLLTCSYRGREFVRVGYYVHVEYDDPDNALGLQDPEPRPPPNPPLLAKLRRSIMADHPRVTRFNHGFDNEAADEFAEADAAAAAAGGAADDDAELLPEDDEDDDDEGEDGGGGGGGAGEEDLGEEDLGDDDDDEDDDDDDDDEGEELLGSDDEMENVAPSPAAAAALGGGGGGGKKAAAAAAGGGAVAAQDMEL